MIINNRLLIVVIGQLRLEHHYATLCAFMYVCVYNGGELEERRT